VRSAETGTNSGTKFSTSGSRYMEWVRQSGERGWPQIELVQVARARHARFFPGFISPLGSKARLTSSWSRTAPGGPLSTQVTVFDDAYSVFAGDRAVELDR
jgi:hypothetical protein